jgi:hypothetical protein
MNSKEGISKLFVFRNYKSSGRNGYYIFLNHDLSKGGFESLLFHLF